MAERVTESVNTWNAQDAFVERLMDDGAFTAAHPDDCLVLAGPARFSPDATQDFLSRLLPLGMMLNMAINVAVPSQPVPTLGSGRTFGVRGKAQYTFSMSRLLVNAPNVLRAVHTTSVQAGLAVDKFDDPAATTPIASFWTNLDSEQYYIPFGLYVIFADKSRGTIGAVALEHVHLTGYNVGVQAGQAMIMENLTGWADRMRPLPIDDLLGANSARPTATVIRDTVLGTGGVSSPNINER